MWAATPLRARNPAAEPLPHRFAHATRLRAAWGAARVWTIQRVGALSILHDLPGSDLWPGKSCCTRQQQVKTGSACRLCTIGDLTKVQFMLGQVVWYPAAASESRLSLPAASGSRTATGSKWVQAQPADSALSETCQTPIYGLASRVVPGGSKWKSHSDRQQVEAALRPAASSGSGHSLPAPALYKSHRASRIAPTRAMAFLIFFTAHSPVCTHIAARCPAAQRREIPRAYSACSSSCRCCRAPRPACRPRRPAAARQSRPRPPCPAPA